MSKIQHTQITSNILIEDIRNQARLLFLVAIIGITTCIIIYSIGAAALIFGKISVGVFTTVASSLSTLPFMHMAKTAHDWLKVAKKFSLLTPEF